MQVRTKNVKPSDCYCFPVQIRCHGTSGPQYIHPQVTIVLYVDLTAGTHGGKNQNNSAFKSCWISGSLENSVSLRVGGKVFPIQRMGKEGSLELRDVAKIIRAPRADGVALSELFTGV